MKKLITILVTFLMLFTVVVPVAAEGEEPLEAGETQVLVEGETSAYAAPQKKYAPAFVAEVDANGDLYIKSEDKEWISNINNVRIVITNGTVVTSAAEAAKKGGNMYMITNYDTSDDTKLITVLSGGPYPAYDGSKAYMKTVSGVPVAGSESNVKLEPGDIYNAYKSEEQVNFWTGDGFLEIDNDNGYAKVSKDILKSFGITSGKYIVYVRASGYYYGYQKDVEFDYIAPRPRTVYSGQNLQLAVGTNRKVEWTSSNETIATVDQDGYVTFKKAQGEVIIYALIDGKVVDECKFYPNTASVELKSTQDTEGNLYIRCEDKELLKAIAAPLVKDENDITISEGGWLRINGVFLKNYIYKKYDSSDIYYEYVETNNDAYVFVPVETIMSKSIMAGSEVSIDANDNESEFSYDIYGTANLSIGCKHYPEDLSVKEDSEGNIVIRTSDVDFLKTLVKNKEEFSGNYYFGFYLQDPEAEDRAQSFYNSKNYGGLLTLKSDSEGSYVVLENKALIDNDYVDGSYKYWFKVYGYTFTPFSDEIKVDIKHGVKEFSGVSVEDKGDDIIITVTGENAKDWISKLVTGNVYKQNAETGWNDSVNRGQISLNLTKDGTNYSGAIYNFAFYDADSDEPNDFELDNIVDNGDGTLTISKSDLKWGFVDGIYDFTFDVNGYTDVTVKGVKLNFGVTHNPVLYTDFKIESDITPIVGGSTDSELINIKVTALNEKGERIDVTKEISGWWAEQKISPYGETYYGRTSDDKFVSGKVYYLCLSYMYQWKGNDKNTVSTIEYNGVKYNEEENFMGARPGCGLDTIDSKQFFIKQTVGSMTKINVPAAKTGLVYNGKSQTGVDTNKQYAVTNNTAVDAGEYTATVKPNPGYCWADGTQVEKEVKFAIAKANPTGYKKPEVTAVYGQRLSEIDIDEAGEWSWVAPTTVINGVGNKTYSAKYTPKDNKNYNSVLDTLTVKVAPKPVTEEDIKVPAASEITYGDKLSASKLSETGWNWTDSSLALTVKNDGAKVQYKVADDVNYDYSKIEGYDAKTHLITRTITVTVKKADPADKTPELKAVYNQLLADITLPERWEFVDAPGTSVGDVGVKGIKVTFTPEDEDNYNVVTREALLTVVKAKPDYTVPEIQDSVVEGTKLSDVSLDKFNGWSWKNKDQVVGDNNIAVFTPEDTKNYLTVEANVKIAVKHEIQITEDIKANVEIKTGVEEKTESTVENKKTEEVKVENNALTETVKDIVVNASTETKSNTEIKDQEKAKEIQEVVKKAVEEAKSISVETVITKEEKKAEEVKKEDKLAVENKMSSNDKVESYLDLNVNLKVKVDGGSEISTAVSKLANPVKLTISIELPADINKQNYEYYIVVIHDGKEPYTIKADLDKDNSSVSFDAQEFSTYALVSRKVVNNPGGGSSGGSSSGNGGYKAPNTKA